MIYADGVLHVIVNTHTPDRLHRTLTALAHQSRPADTVTLTCDGDGDDLLRAVHRVHGETGLRVVVVRRPKADPDCLAQVRNNAARALVELNAFESDDDSLVFLDGDCVTAHDFVEQHAACAREGQLVLGRRYDLTEAQTDAFDDDALAAGRPPVELTPAQRRELEQRQARYRRQLFFKRIGLGKPHKPKILGANFGVTWRVYCDVNGNDETFVRWGVEDDDFARRCYQAGARPVIAITRVICYHQWHPTRAPSKHRELDNHARLGKKSVPTRCEVGLDNPREQGPVTIDVVG